MCLKWLKSPVFVSFYRTVGAILLRESTDPRKVALCLILAHIPCSIVSLFKNFQGPAVFVWNNGVYGSKWNPIHVPWPQCFGILFNYPSYSMYCRLSHYVGNDVVDESH